VLDYLIVGSGLFGSVFARQMTDLGKRCLVIEKRPHIAGNCFTEPSDGIILHAYGPHFFHTNSKRIWDYINRFATFSNYVHRGAVRRADRLFSFPINLRTLQQVWGITTPQEAQRKLQQVRHNIPHPKNLEEWALAHVGTEIYELFIKGYTTKQWLRHPKDLPASIIQRLPIRLADDDRYYDDQFQGVPLGGYTPIFEKLLAGIPVELGLDYLAHRARLDPLARRIVYTGPIDAFFDHCHGHLEYRTLRFERQRLPQPFFQNSAMVNYADVNIPFTRIIEHKHIQPPPPCAHTIITREYPEPWTPHALPLYPIEDAPNTALFAKYRALAASQPHILFGGRLAEYRYFDMHHVIGAALAAAAKEGTRTPSISASSPETFTQPKLIPH
jgi:UDP-galactopyranose mutase